MLGEGEWKPKKHGAEYHRRWRKVHLGIDVETLQIQDIEVIDKRQGDVQVLPSLLEQIPVDEKITCVSGDGVFDTKVCHEATAARGAIGCIPTRKNVRPVETGCAGSERAYAGFQAIRKGDLGALEKHHRRRQVETKMYCFKRLGERVTIGCFDGQVTGLQVRAAILSRFSLLGRPYTVAVV